MTDKKQSVGRKTLTNMAIFLGIFILLTIHVLAVAISLQCNRSENLFYTISTAIFAFMFGIFYIVVNYYYLRLYKSKNVCNFSTDKIFSLF